MKRDNSPSDMRFIRESRHKYICREQNMFAEIIQFTVINNQSDTADLRDPPPWQFPCQVSSEPSMSFSSARNVL